MSKRDAAICSSWTASAALHGALVAASALFLVPASQGDPHEIEEEPVLAIEIARSASVVEAAWTPPTAPASLSDSIPRPEQLPEFEVAVPRAEIPPLEEGDARLATDAGDGSSSIDATADARFAPLDSGRIPGPALRRIGVGAGAPASGDAPGGAALGDPERRAAPAGSPGGAGAAEVAPDQGPRLLSSPSPTYPPASVRAGEEGRVECVMRIDAHGCVVLVEVEKGSGHARLDRAAREGLLMWRFAPAVRDGVAVESRLAHTVTFRLR